MLNHNDKHNLVRIIREIIISTQKIPLRPDMFTENYDYQIDLYQARQVGRYQAFLEILIKQLNLGHSLEDISF